MIDNTSLRAPPQRRHVSRALAGRRDWHFEIEVEKTINLVFRNCQPLTGSPSRREAINQRTVASDRSTNGLEPCREFAKLHAPTAPLRPRAVPGEIVHYVRQSSNSKRSRQTSRHLLAGTQRPAASCNTPARFSAYWCAHQLLLDGHRASVSSNHARWVCRNTVLSRRITAMAAPPRLRALHPGVFRT